MQFLAERLRECEEATLHALEPEFSRLRVTAEQDLADLTAKLAEDTRRMKVDLKKLYESKLAAEEKHLRDNQRMLARVRLDEAVSESDQLEREHKRSLVVMTEDLTKALDSFRRSISQKVRHFSGSSHVIVMYIKIDRLIVSFNSLRYLKNVTGET